MEEMEMNILITNEAKRELDKLLENSDKKVEKAPVFGNPYVKKINNVRKSV